MQFLEILILSFIQGLSEVLPISSSMHLYLSNFFFGFQDPTLAFVVASHAGSLLAFVFFFFKDLKLLFQGVFDVFKGKVTLEFYQGLQFICATMPVIVFGYFANKYFDFSIKDQRVVGGVSILFAVLLWMADRTSIKIQSLRHMTLKRSLFIGLFQVFAIMPGVSRSGVTLTAARFLGFSREDAAKFIFIMAIPTIFGAVVLKSMDLVTLGQSLFSPEILMAIFYSCVWTLLFLHLLFRWIQKYTLTPIIIYRVILGLILIIYAK